MYLWAKTKEHRDYINPQDEDKEELKDVAYWRKANQIHSWFLEALNLPYDFNCENAEVTKDILEDLVEDCKQALESHDLAEEIMPTYQGFFFGSYEYDDCYFEQLSNTVAQVENIIKQTDWNNTTIFYSCWW